MDLNSAETSIAKDGLGHGAQQSALPFPSADCAASCSHPSSQLLFWGTVGGSLS